MKRFLYLLCSISIFFLFFSSCNQDKNNYFSSSNVYKSKDIAIPKTIKHIVSVSPQVTEILCDLNKEDLLIGRTNFCKYPPSVQKIESIGGITDANLEKIIALKPDIVITSSIFPIKSVSVIEQANIPVISFHESRNIEGMYEVIAVLGEITSSKHRADSLITDCKQRLQAITTAYKNKLDKENLSKPKVYYVVGFGQSGDFTATGDTYINDILQRAGGDNIAKNAQNWSFSKELLFKNQPDYIFIRSEDLKTFCNQTPYKDLTAVKSCHVYPIESLDTQTPRSISAIEQIFNIIYSDK